MRNLQGRMSPEFGVRAALDGLPSSGGQKKSPAEAGHQGPSIEVDAHTLRRFDAFVGPVADALFQICPRLPSVPIRDDLDYFYIGEVVMQSAQVVGRHGLAIDSVASDRFLRHRRPALCGSQAMRPAKKRSRIFWGSWSLKK
jgi:hypothetical protein